jgi:hypothetical protein
MTNSQDFTKITAEPRVALPAYYVGVFLQGIYAGIFEKTSWL